MTFQEIIAENFYDYRRIYGLSQAEIAARIGISKELISLIERKKVHPTTDTLDRIAAYMGILPHQLLTPHYVRDHMREAAIL